LTSAPVPAGDLGTAPALAALSLEDDRGSRVRLGDLWRESPVLLLFLRHWG
jgi:hypothetical protein